MARIFIDLTEDETHWNGEIEVQIIDRDGLSGTDMALAIGHHQIVLTISQAVTLYDLLDGWMHSGGRMEVGAVRRRVHEAVRGLIADRKGVLGRLFTPTFTEESFVREIEEYLRLNGLRFRITGEEPAFARSPRRGVPADPSEAPNG